MKNKIPIVLSTIALFFVSLPANAQWTITPTMAATQLAQSIVGLGVTVTNASLTCGNGSAAEFQYAGANMGLSGGILLSTGMATVAAESYTTFAAKDMDEFVLDPDLDLITPNSDYDLCRLEFDFVPICPNISLRYVFASEEYPNFVNSDYNDVFGIFITGPNPAGGTYASPNNNIARLPNGDAVAINTVNQNSNASLFVPNEDCLRFSPTYSAITGAHYPDVVYGGFTMPIASTVAVVPCQTYHLKFAIADVNDPIYDSGVLISNDGVACVNQPTISVLASAGNCQVGTGSATVQVAGASPLYQWLPGGQTTASISGQAPGTYTCILTFTNACISYTTSELVTITAPALQSPTLEVGANMPCAGATLSLTAQSNANQYNWWGPGGFSSSLQNPVVANITPTAAGLYTLTVTNASGCTASAAIRIEVSTIHTPTISVSGSSCSGSTMTLSAQPNGVTYAWSGPGGFSSSLQNPVISGITTTATGIYSLTITNSNGCTASRTVQVQVNATPSPTASGPGSVCSGSTVSLSAQPNGATYAWSGPGGFSSSLQNPVVSGVTSAGIYTLIATNASGCSASRTVQVQVNAAPSPTASGPGSACSGSTVSLSAQPNGATYAWSGPGGFSSSLQNPVISGITTSATGVYSLTVTNSNGCAASRTVQVQIDAVSVPTASGPDSVCSGSTMSLSAQPNGATYAWSGPGGFNSSLQNPVVSGLTSANSGVYTLTVTNASGCSATHTISILVQSTPTVSLSSNSPVCEGGNLVFQASGATTYSWTGPSGFVAAQASPTIAPVAVDQAGVYTLKARNINQECEVTHTLNVVVNPRPVLLAGSNSPQCAGSAVNLTASGGATYQWTGPNGFSTVAQNPVLTQPAASQSGTYQVTTLSALGCAATTTINVEVRLKPVATGTINSPVCSGAMVSLNAEGGTAYNWSGPAGFTSMVKNPVLSPAAVPNAGTYTVVVSAQGCSTSFTLDLMVNPTPTVVASSNSPVCIGSPLNLHAAGGDTYSWSGPQSFSSTQKDPAIIPVIDMNGGMYTVTVTAGPCSAVGQVAVIVNDPPAAVPQSNGPLCAGTTLSLSVSEGTTWQWSGPNNFNSVLQSVAIGSVSPLNNGVYTVTVSNPFCSRTSTIAVQVYAAASLTASSTGSVCAGQPLQFSANGAGQGLSYNWTGPSGFTSSLQNPVIDHAVPANAGTYTVEVKTVNGCSANTNISVVVDEMPGGSIGSNSPLCEGGKLMLQVSGGTQYQWQGPNGFVSTTQYPAMDPVTVGMSGVYTVTVSNGVCKAIRNLPVQVRALPAGSFTAASRAGCPVFCTDFSAQAADGMGFQWNFGNGSQANGAQVQQVCYPTSGSYDVSLVLTDPVAGCTRTITQQAYITVYPTPIAGFDWTLSTGTGEISSTVQFNDRAQGLGLQTWTWNFGDGSNPSSDQNPLHTYQAAGTYGVTQEVINTYGCKSQARGSIVIKDAFTLYIPNAFTPGKGDGLNDVFNVVGLGFAPDQFELMIFDRWGELIFKTNDVNRGWDGYLKNRVLAEQGVYVYKIVARESEHHKLHEYVGHVTLL